MATQMTEKVYNLLQKAIQSVKADEKVELSVHWRTHDSWDRMHGEDSLVEIDRTDSFPKTWAAYAFVFAATDVNHEELGKRFEDDGFKVSYLDHVRFGRVISEIVRPRAKN